jgi:hypothetical protein
MKFTIVPALLASAMVAHGLVVSDTTADKIDKRVRKPFAFPDH